MRHTGFNTPCYFEVIWASGVELFLCIIGVHVGFFLNIKIKTPHRNFALLISPRIFKTKYNRRTLFLLTEMLIAALQAETQICLSIYSS